VVSKLQNPDSKL